jgi:beta-glucosidase
MKFPDNFSFGVSTASYQIEGNGFADGRGISIWDTFAATPGKVADGDNGDVACDHYNRYPQDIALMKELGVDAYRFSIAWPRLFPQGDSRREQRGFDFYNRLIDELLANDIKPLATLYHWDMPQPIEDRGGWADRAIVAKFTDYGIAAAEAFADRITDWITINEPWCVSWLGYGNGVHAPGRQDLDAAVAAAHHTAMAHGAASRAMKQVAPHIRTGLALNMTTYRVQDESDPELTDLRTLMDGELNRWWLDAAMLGRYPHATAKAFGERLEKVLHDGDLDVAHSPLDFLGVNYYSDSFLGSPKPEDKPAIEGGLFPFPQRSNGAVPEPHTDMGWPVTPRGLYDLLIRIKNDWPEITDIAVTENGAAYPEEPNALGDVEDDRRVEYLVSHMNSVAEAASDGVPISAYFYWSLLDNFEWAEGYRKRFGIVHVDYVTQKRTIKKSGYVFRDLIAEHKNSCMTLSESRV